LTLPRLVQRLPDRAAEAAGEHALLDRDEQLVLGRKLRDEAAVDRLGEARVRDRCRDPVLGEELAAPSALPTPVP
jgi:hypothetical protein